MIADRVSNNVRSEIMRKVKSKNTVPELIVRSAAHSIGLRFRLYRKDLPGRPDLVFPKYRVVIFVHGCFWHRHKGCRLSSMPKSNKEFWAEKFSRNVERDKVNMQKLKNMGWKPIIIWQCEIKNADSARDIIVKRFHKLGVEVGKQ